MIRADHHFNPELAAQYGVDAAILIHDVAHWVEHNRGNETNRHDGRYWTYCTMNQLCERHPYWSRRQIERILATCRDKGLLLVGCYNKDPRDRTKWYTLGDAMLEFFFCPSPTPEGAEEAPPDSADCNSRNGEMELTEGGNEYHQTGTALPNNRPDNSKNNPPISPQGGRRRRSAEHYKPRAFDSLYAYYPRHVGREAAQRAWDKLKPSPEIIEAICVALKLQKAYWTAIGTPKDKIPHLSTWLNGKRWTDDPDDYIPPEASERDGGSGGWAPDPEVM